MRALVLLLLLLLLLGCAPTPPPTVRAVHATALASSTAFVPYQLTAPDGTPWWCCSASGGQCSDVRNARYYVECPH